ncbi:hypothetical protein AUK22_00325 [bacterium CG2_30_54_10]|nr:MAG: hypothetical protein AUK22_00325 [bacterium CG2_30_54_10]
MQEFPRALPPFPEVSRRAHGEIVLSQTGYPGASLPDSGLTESGICFSAKIHFVRNRKRESPLFSGLSR